MADSNFFSRLDARARVFVLLLGVAGIIFAIYLATKFFSNEGGSIGPSSVAGAPSGLQSVPGGALTAEYSKALQQANAQAAQQAKMSGTSAVPTLMNYGGQPSGSNSGCYVCSSEAANVKDDLDNWVKQGKLAPETATALQQLADKNTSPSEYAAELDKLVKEGKLTPEQARALLDKYTKQYAAQNINESASAMDDIIKSGKLPLDTANQLLDGQKKHVSPADYAAQLQEMVRQGKISPEVAQQLLTQYTQQHTKEVVNGSIASLKQLEHNGQITSDVAKELIELEHQMVPLDVYSTKLQRFVEAGKMIPAVAGKILDEFKAQKASIGPTSAINQIIHKAETAAFDEIRDLLKEKKITEEVGAQLTDMINKSIPFEAFVKEINNLVQDGKLSPEIAKLKIADYKAVKGSRDMLENLSKVQANNGSESQYADELKHQVQAGVIKPEEAAELMRQYQASNSKGGFKPTGGTGGETVEAFAKLQERVAASATDTQPTATTDQFVEEQAKVSEEVSEKTSEQQQQELQALMNAMSGQAGQLISAWQAPTMAYRAGTAESESKSPTGTGSSKTTSSDSSDKSGTSSTITSAPVLMKAGTIAFAVLDTAVNSDYVDSPVMATIIEGPLKGAKLLGKLVTSKSVSGQLDRVSLNFTLMNLETWPKSKAVTAYAIDPDTAKTMLASRVDYHYLQRFGAMMATSFLQGYGNAVTNSGSTATTGIFGTSTAFPGLSPTQKFAAALGQMGQAVGAATQNYVNIPPTVKVDSGVGLGILFMTDVT